MREINIAAKIIQKRKEKGITQEDLATYVGVSKASVSKWENSQSYPDITLLPILATYFDISVDELIGYSPQLTMEAISEVYKKLTELFTTQGYDKALNECDQISKKYYNCYELQIQLCTLYINYSINAPSKELHDSMLEYVVEGTRRIKAESEEPILIQEANGMEAMAQLLLEQPLEVIELLEDSIINYQSNEVTLSNAYMMLGKQDKAKETVQFSCYIHLINLMQDLQYYILLFVNEPDRFEEIKNRILQVEESFHFSKLNTNCMAISYLTIAQGYVQQGKLEQALDMLQKYVAVCKLFEFPLELKGDDFFDVIEHKFDSLKVMRTPPRAEKDIKNSIVSAVKDNPVFVPLHDKEAYKQIIKALERI